MTKDACKFIYFFLRSLKLTVRRKPSVANGLACLLVFSTVLVGCEFGSEKNATSKTQGERAAKISWFNDSMESALTKAKEVGKPLFVYWGAKWCPPCNVMKSTVFTEPVFINATKKYISVYLDGDSESAQEWGEKLHASGYPTLMVLNPEGEEIVRLNSDMTASDFAATLDSVSENLNPIQKVIEEVQKTAVNKELSKKVPLETWRLLANYSWSQAKTAYPDMDWVQVYRDLESKVPESYKNEKDLLYLNWLSARLSQISSEKKKDPAASETTGLSEQEKASIQARLKPFFENTEDFKKNIGFFAYMAGDLTEVLFDLKKSKDDKTGLQAAKDFVSKYRATLGQVRGQLEIGSHDRMTTYYPLVDWQELDEDNWKVSETEKNQAVEMVEKSLAAAKTPSQQIFVTSSGSYILRKLGLADKAKKILLKDIETSKTPYYSMAGLASLEKKAGNNEDAIRWMERAYESSDGLATRLQWGSSFVIYLMTLRPDDESRVFKEVEKFYRTHLKLSDAFMGRNKARLNRVAKELKTWAKDDSRKRQVEKLTETWKSQCESTSKGKTKAYRESCEEYFKTLI